MTVLRRKLVRDLWRLRYQSLSIALLVGCGIASFVAAMAASASLQASRNEFYKEARLGDVFVHLKRAPRPVLDRLRDLPGVAAADGRVVEDFRIELEGSTEPVAARFISLAWPQEERLNQVKITKGRLAEPLRADEVVVGEALAEAWGLVPGSTITAVINEHRTRLRIVGIGVSPEYAFALAPATGLPDPRHFGVIWMDEDALSKATGFVGAFNDVSLELATSADLQETLRRVDQILEPYGGLGAVGRVDQPSAKLVQQKIVQLSKLARTLPVIFLGVASFLLHVLLSRIVGTQREQIATLKALGYRTRELSSHYLEFAVTICTLGALFGIALGVFGGVELLRMYALYFKFPAFLFRFNLGALIVGTLFAFAAGLLGTVAGVRRAVALPAAEGMRPEAPPSYRATAFDWLYRVTSPVVRMVLRDVQRKPVRLLLSAVSIALATSIVLAGSVFKDSLKRVLQLEFEVSQREQISVRLDDARSWRAVRELAHLPGVVKAEGERIVPVRLRAGPRFRTTVILGLPHKMDLFRLLDAKERPLKLPEGGLSLSRVLGEELGLRAGDSVEIDVLEGDRRKLWVPVVALVDDLIGLSAYMDTADLNRMLGEAPRVNRVLLAIESPDIDEVMQRLNALPAVEAVSRPDLDRDLVHAEVADVFTVASLVLAVLAAAIAVGVVYNNARIALEVRSRDLATLRILGFSRGELAGVLLGEQAIEVSLGIAAGLVLGKAFGTLWLSSIDKELLRIPPALAPASYVGAICIVALAALASALIVRRQSDRLDLVAALKARD